MPRFLLTCAFLVFAAAPSFAQQPPAIRSTAELVKIDVTVLDKHGEYIAGLAQQDFRVLDNSVPSPIAYFAPVDAPARVLVIVETSPAVYLIQNQHLSAAYSLLQGLRSDDEVALIAYDAAPRPLLSFTSDKSALLQALGQLQYSLGSTQLNFFDSVSTSLDWLAPAAGKKAIVLLTTGLDSSPPSHWDALVSKLRANDVVIYSVALGGGLRRAPGKSKQSKKSKKSDEASADSAGDDENPLSFQKADAALNSLAATTGGQSFFPNSPEDFHRIYSGIATILRHQYVLGIAPSHDSQFHTLSVEVLDSSVAPSPPATGQSSPAKSALRIFHRQGYQAPAP